MPTLIEHRPGFVDSSDEPEKAEFETEEDIQNIPFVKRFMHQGFTWFEVRPNVVVAHYADGKYWVVGHIRP